MNMSQIANVSKEVSKKNATCPVCEFESNPFDVRDHLMKKHKYKIREAQDWLLPFVKEAENEIDPFADMF